MIAVFAKAVPRERNHKLGTLYELSSRDCLQCGGYSKIIIHWESAEGSSQDKKERMGFIGFVIFLFYFESVNPEIRHTPGATGVWRAGGGHR
jgi:hypothetical protein